MERMLERESFVKNSDLGAEDLTLSFKQRYRKSELSKRVAKEAGSGQFDAGALQQKKIKYQNKQQQQKQNIVTPRVYNPRLKITRPTLTLTVRSSAVVSPHSLRFSVRGTLAFSYMKPSTCLWFRSFRSKDEYPWFQVGVTAQSNVSLPVSLSGRYAIVPGPRLDMRV